MAEKIFGAPGCNKSELKLVKRQPAAAASLQTGNAPASRATR